MLPRSRISNLPLWTIAFAFFAVVGVAEAQMAGIESFTVPVRVDSGIVQNVATEPAVVFSTQVRAPGVTWLRLKFDHVKLAGDVGADTGSYLLVTSLYDGATQYLNAEHVEQWQHTSAYFNGDTVLLELVAHPGTGENRVAITEALSGRRDANQRSICGPTDDRTLSYDVRQGRFLPGGCTAWLINDCNHCFLTAGHCSDSNNVVEFNVPLSNGDGSLNHPPPEDQYSVDPASVQSNGGQGVGDDWAYFGCFPNSNTGLTPGEAQEAYYTLSTPPPSGFSQDIRITGYGTVSAPVSMTWYQVQKTHVGPYVTFSGTTLGYQTDTTGGNSGSPVVIMETGQAIGIHTHGGCNYSGGENNGTGLNHTGVQTALANPQGVCIPMVGLRVTPNVELEAHGDPGGPFTPESLTYTLENLESTPLDYEVTKTQPWISLTNATGTLAGYATATVMVSINAGANSLAEGEYTDTVSFVNTTSHEGDTTREVTLVVGGPQPIHSWSMDIDPGWTTQGLWAWGQPTGSGGDHGNPDPTSGYTSSNVYGYNLNGDYENQLSEQHLTSSAIDCSNLTAVTLHFYRWLGVERNSYDHAYVRVSNDGVSWATVWENPNSEIADSAWLPQEIDISSYADNQPTVYLRWTMGSTDYSWQYCGWNIDDVELWAFAEPQDLKGDLDCDGDVDFDDINPFILALSGQTAYLAQYPDCNWLNADCNADGNVDFDDINALVALLEG